MGNRTKLTRADIALLQQIKEHRDDLRRQLKAISNEALARKFEVTPVVISAAMNRKYSYKYTGD